MRIQSLCNFLFNAVKSTATNKQNVFRVHRNHFLIGMLTATLWRHIHNRSFQQFQQSLLNTFTANVTSDGRIITFTCNLINFIDKDNSLFGFGHIIISNLKQTSQNTLNVFTHITGFRQYRGIYNSKRYVQQLCNGTRQQCFTCSRTSYHDDI